MIKTPNTTIFTVVDTVLFTIIEDTLKVLCVTRQRDPFDGQKTLPGTYIRNQESSKVAALRALREKAGVDDIYIEQLYTFDDIGRDPRGQYLSVAYLSLANSKILALNISEVTQNPEFVDVDTALGFDHNNIVKYAISRLRSKLEYTNVAQHLLPNIFTLSELQNVYEVVLGQVLDKRNFRKKILSLGIIKTTGDTLSGLRQRPALLYKFKTQDLVELQRWF